MQDHTTLRAWQTAHRVAAGVHRVARRYWTGSGSPVAQLRRSALSVQLNLAEGYTSKPGARWKHHLRIALGSAAETSDGLYFLLELKAVPAELLCPLIADAERCKRLIRGLLR